MKLIKMKCDNCGATLEVNQDLERIRCSYCGAEILIDDEATKLKRVEDVKLKARQENHAQDMKERQERHEQDIKEQKEKEEKEEILNFKKGKFSKIILIFAILCLVITFVRQFNISSIISIVQAALFLAAWLFGMNIIKEPVKNLHTILAVIGFILIVPFFAFGTFSFKDLPDKINWNDIALREHLPEPTVLKGKISKKC